MVIPSGAIISCEKYGSSARVSKEIGYSWLPMGGVAAALSSGNHPFAHRGLDHAWANVVDAKAALGVFHARSW
jgi:hypothetical protein